jgi:hypothetical protein
MGTFDWAKAAPERPATAMTRIFFCIMFSWVEVVKRLKSLAGSKSWNLIYIFIDIAKIMPA